MRITYISYFPHSTFKYEPVQMLPNLTLTSTSHMMSSDLSTGSTDPSLLESPKQMQARTTETHGRGNDQQRAHISGFLLLILLGFFVSSDHLVPLSLVNHRRASRSF